MSGLVDYAGLFPPASLDMATAVDEYAAHLVEQEAWMLGRFIVPAGRLAELQAACERFLDDGQEWAFSVLVGGRQNSETALAAAEAQGRAAVAFEQRFAGRARIEVLEGMSALLLTRVWKGVNSTSRCCRGWMTTGCWKRSTLWPLSKHGFPAWGPSCAVAGSLPKRFRAANALRDSSTIAAVWGCL
jgi:hypothetical protein